ncbi:MAG: extracellular solute-binding protein [Nocardioidaceae bacterium]
MRYARVLVATLLVLGVSSCGFFSSGDTEEGTIKVAYQKYGGFIQVDHHLKQIKAQFEKQHPGKKVELIPIEASENDYYAKLNLMQRSEATAPDVLYEDTFLINSDIEAGYLKPMDGYLSKWDEWSQYYDSAKRSVEGLDGKTYGVPMGTDTRALWYNKELFRKAGLPVPWQPQTWDDVLSAARTVKQELPGVIPLNVYSGKPAGEASTMQGFEMLLYGTDDTLYDASSGKWIGPSAGFSDALRFVQTVYQEGLGPSVQQALDPNVGTVVASQWLPEGKLAINLDGSWLPHTWIEEGDRPWPEWHKVMGYAPMPTQKGEGEGSTSMSGGWALSIGSKSADPDLAWDFISLALNEQNSTDWITLASEIPVREDVARKPEYLHSNPSAKFFSDLVSVTNYRPALPPYAKISFEIQVAMEAVMSGQAAPDEAMGDYVTELKGIVGEQKVTDG